ncbi:MAG TPA: ATP-binding protein [Coleofasciculaceae cyanobacterium]|jgi:signal transduction histidine kinase/CheY-like chemotaxis protein
MNNNPPSLLSETERLKALRRYNILDTPPDGSFDRITSMAARLLKVPIAVVSLVDSDRIWFKSHHGLDVQQIDHCPGLCASAILSPEFYVITDASQDVRSLANPLVAGEFGLRFYAAAPLTTHDGYNLGTLCVIDKQPRSISPEELEVLKDLAAVVIDEIELRLAARNIDQLNNELEQEVEERKQAESVAQAANQAKSEFLANMSHELRSPLNAILGFAQLMTRSQTLPSEHQENVGIIRSSGEHLLTLINNVLDLSKIEAGGTTLNENDFDLYRLLDELDDLFRLKADDKGLQLVFDHASDVPQYVRTDDVKLRQVLINLLNNALKFTKQGGVSLKVNSQNPPGAPPCSGTCVSNPAHSTVKSEAEIQTTLTFEVEDTGVGIAPDELDSLFEAFVQTQAGKEAQEGTGLGLAISRKFVKLMGGEMTVSSQVGRGSIFKFDIQVSRVDAAAIKTHQPTGRIIALEPNQPRYRILIVDDKWSNRQLLMKLLNPLGFELKEASNGEEAIATWENWEPHLIWMDMRMPMMDGYEATKRIKATTKGQATAIIALTASVLEEERAVILSGGCEDFVRKPFREADIFDMMHKHLGVRYVYEEATDSRQQYTQSQNSPIGFAFATLPTELVTNLQQAAIRIDMDRIDSLIAQIHTYDASLASRLSLLAADFKYDEILTLIQQSYEMKLI